MKKNLVIFTCFVGIVGCGSDTPVEMPGYTEWASVTATPVEATPALLAHGKSVYAVRCERCHGISGDGQGPTSLYMSTPPRDFRRGLFKFRSSPSGEHPTDLDLFRTVTAGFPAYGMPRFDYLSEQDRWALVHYVKTFIERRDEEAAQTLEIGEPPAPSDALFAQGLEVFTKAQCGKCHGEDGRGSGPSAEGLEDGWGHPIRTLDLTSAAVYYMTGARPDDIMRTLSTGLMGTPMPSYFESGFTREELWSLAYYISSLSGEKERDSD